MVASGDGHSAQRRSGEVWEGRTSCGASVERGEANDSDGLGRVALKKRRHGGVTSPASKVGSGWGMQWLAQFQGPGFLFIEPLAS